MNASVLNHDDRDKMSIYDVNWMDKWKDLVIYPITWLQQKGYRKLHAGVLLTTRLVKGKVGGDGICRGPRDAFYFEPITNKKRFPEFVKGVPWRIWLHFNHHYQRRAGWAWQHLHQEICKIYERSNHQQEDTKENKCIRDSLLLTKNGKKETRKMSKTGTEW